MKKLTKGLIALSAIAVLGCGVAMGTAGPKASAALAEGESTTTTHTWYFMGGPNNWTASEEYTITEGTPWSIDMTADQEFKFTGASGDYSIQINANALVRSLTNTVLGWGNSDYNAKAPNSGTYTFTFQPGLYDYVTSVTEAGEYASSDITYSEIDNYIAVSFVAPASGYKVTKTAVINGVEQDPIEEILSDVSVVHTLAEVTVPSYPGYTFASYGIDGSETTDTTTVIASDTAVMLNYSTNSTNVIYKIDYSNFTDVFGDTVYVHSWGNNGYTTWPGIKVATAEGIATVSLDGETSGFNFTNNIVQTTNVTPSEVANDTFVITGKDSTDNSKYTGTWRSVAGYTVTKTYVINGVAQDVVTETVSSGSTLADLTLSAYGYIVSGYKIDGTEVPSTTVIDGDTAVTVNFVAEATSTTYYIDVSAYSGVYGSEFADSIYIYLVGSDGETSWPGYKWSQENNLVTVQSPADCTLIILSNSNKAQTADITPSEIVGDIYVLNNFNDQWHHEGYWKSELDTFVDLVFSQTETLCDGAYSEGKFDEVWATLKTAYEALSTNSQSAFTSAVADGTNTSDLSGAAARYDVIRIVYGVEDFAGRLLTTNSSYRVLKEITTEEKNSLVAVISVSALGIAGAAIGLFLLKKKKEN